MAAPTVEAFIDRAFALAKTEGAPYLRRSDAAACRQLAQEQLDIYTAKTHCLQADNVTFTPIIGYGTYDLSKTSITIAGIATTYLAYRMVEVRYVTIDGGALQVSGDALGTPGMSSEYQINLQSGGYLTAGNGKPGAAWFQPPNSLRFSCPFDQVYTNCYVGGRRYHSELLKDTQELELASEDIGPAARLYASELLMANSKDKAMALRQVAEMEMKQRRASCTSRMAASSQRGGVNPQQVVNFR